MRPDAPFLAHPAPLGRRPLSAVMDGDHDSQPRVHGQSLREDLVGVVRSLSLLFARTYGQPLPQHTTIEDNYFEGGVFWCIFLGCLSKLS